MLLTPSLDPRDKHATDFSEQLVPPVVDALSAQIAILDETGTIVAVNSAWREFAENNPPVPSNAFEGANYLRVCDTASGPCAAEAPLLADGMRAVLRGETRMFSLEYPCHSPETKRWFIVRVTRSAGDAHIRVVVAHEDITERRNAEDAIKAAEMRFRSLFEKSSDALLILDISSWLIMSANPAAIAMFGARDEADFRSRPPWDYSPERQQNGRISAELVEEIGKEVIREGSRLQEWTCKRIDGKEFPVTLLLSRIATDAETILLVTIRDISLEKRVAAEYEKGLHRLEGMSQLRQSLLVPITLEEKLKKITDGVGRVFDMDFCRVWVIRPGDLCDKGCMHAEVADGPDACRDRTRCLHLVSSSGRYIHTDGKLHARVPLNCYEIGRLVSGSEHKVVIEAVQSDPRIHDHEWARSLGLKSFSGYQLQAKGERPLGVLACFSKHAIPPDQHEMLDGLCSTMAMVIQIDAAELQLKESDDRYGALFGGSLALVYLCDFEGRFIDANDAVFKLLGYSKEEFSSLNLSSMMTEDDLAVALRTLQEIRETGHQKTPTEYRLRHKNGSFVEVETTGSAVSSGGKVVATQHIANDISERRRASERTKQLMEELDRSNKELQQFAYIASHDLQEPLRMVSSYTQLLARRYKGRLDKDADEFIAFAVDGATRMQTLINDLLAFSRVGTRGKVFESTDSSQAFDQAIANLRMGIQESSAEVTHGDLPIVTADKLQFGQLFQNLIGNAIKYHGAEPPRVHVWAERKGGDWVFSVRDNGIGIDPKYSDRLFVLFQRLHTREEYPGTGIGLAICKKIVERHKGHIWEESQPGCGATFSFTIPVGGSGS